MAAVLAQRVGVIVEGPRPDPAIKGASALPAEVTMAAAALGNRDSWGPATRRLGAIVDDMAALGVRVGTVKSRTSRALEHLRESYA